MRTCFRKAFTGTTKGSPAHNKKIADDLRALLLRYLSCQRLTCYCNCSKQEALSACKQNRRRRWKRTMHKQCYDGLSCTAGAAQDQWQDAWDAQVARGGASCAARGSGEARAYQAAVWKQWNRLNLTNKSSKPKIGFLPSINNSALGVGGRAQDQRAWMALHI